MAEKGKPVLIAAFWLFIWQGAALLVHNPIVLVGPLETGRALLTLWGEGAFWRAVATTLGQIALGLFCGGALGILLAALGCRFRAVRALLSPLVGVIRAVPVVSFVILALLWFTAKRLSLFVTLTVVLPIFYLNTLAGLLAADPQLLELAKVYRMGLFARIRAIYLPALRPQLTSAAELAVGMAWKSGLAAEVIGQPLGTLGNTLYRAKIYLETDRVLAVTAMAVLLSWGFGKLLLWLLKKGVGA